VYRAILLLLLASGAAAQPVISSGGVVNAASFLPANSPGGAIAQGSIFSIFGKGLGPSSLAQAERFPLETTLAGVRVRLLHLQTGAPLDAIPLFVSEFQINAILPSTTPVGSVAVTVNYNGRSSAAQTAKVVRSSFGVFMITGAAVVQNYVSPEEQPLNSPAAPAAPGQTVILWGTGLGPIAVPDGAGPVPEALDVPVEVTLGGRPVVIDYRGRSGCCAGVDQINFRIPADAPTGCAVPLAVKVQGGVYGNVAPMAVGSGSLACAGAPSIPARAGRFGDISLVRSTSGAGTQDTARGFFLREERSDVHWPAAGTCVSSGFGVPVFAIPMEAGPLLTIEGPQGTRQIPRAGPGAYYLDSTGIPLFLGPGTYTASGTSGVDVGPFRASLLAPSAPNWTTAGGDRGRGITLAWTGGEPPGGLIGVSGQSFFCTASASAGSITVPPAVVANLPASLAVSLIASSGSAFLAEGLDAGFFSYAHFNSRFVDFGEPPLASSPVRLPNDQTILAELAASGGEQQRGLMLRAELAADRGMLFLFDRLAPYPFWMFRTLIPLDIVWMDRDRRIVFISANTPPCRSEDSRNCPTYGGNELSQYVLELAAGQAARQGLQVGDRLSW